MFDKVVYKVFYKVFTKCVAEVVDNVFTMCLKRFSTRCLRGSLQSSLQGVHKALTRPLQGLN